MSEEKKKSWLDDAGVIGYHPLIHPPETREELDDPMAESERASDDSSSFTPVLKQLDELAPYRVLEQIQSMQSVVHESLEALGNNLSIQTFSINGQTIGNSQFQTWLRDAIYQFDKYQQLLDWRNETYPETKTDFSVEAFEQISLALSELEKIESYFKNLMYSSDRSIVDQIADEQSMIRRVKELELNDTVETINYAAISVDIQLGDSVLKISQAIYRYALRLFNYWQNDIEWQPSYDYNEEALEALKAVYDSYVQTQHRDLSQLERSLRRSIDGSLLAEAQHQREIFLKTIRQKQTIGEALDGNSSLSGYYQLTIDRMHEVMVNLYRYAEFASMAYEDLFNAFTEKEKLRQIFRA